MSPTTTPSCGVCPTPGAEHGAWLRGARAKMPFVFPIRLYAHLFDYDIISLQPPYKPDTYVEAIKAAEEYGADVIIIDSLSHAWSDEGGLLDQADKLSAKGNRYTVWADLTPQHRKLVNGMLNSPVHIIATVRSKQAYEMEEYSDSHGNKKQRPVKNGFGSRAARRHGI